MLKCSSGNMKTSDIIFFPLQQLDQQPRVQQTGPILQMSAPHHRPSFPSTALLQLTWLMNHVMGTTRETTFPSRKAVTGTKTSFRAHKHVHSLGGCLRISSSFIERSREVICHKCNSLTFFHALMVSWGENILELIWRASHMPEDDIVLDLTHGKDIQQKYKKKCHSKVVCLI